MSEQKETKIALVEEFLTFQDTTDVPKMLRLKKKIQKFLRSSYDDNTQLLDAIRVLDLWIDDHEYNDYEHSNRIASPVAERLAYKKNWDFFDTNIAMYVVAYRQDYKATHEFAQKILAAVEDYKSDKRYDGIKIVVCMNVLHRLLKAKYFELSFPENANELAETTALFTEYADLALELCADHEWLLWYKTTTLLRKALFEQNYEEVDANLAILKEKSNSAQYRIIAEEVNGYSTFAGANLTKTQLNLQVGANIRQIRKSRYLSLETLGAGVGISYASLQAIEQGNISLTVYNLHKLSQFFDMPADEILYGKSNTNSKPEPSHEIKELLAYAEELSKAEVIVLSNVAKQMAKDND